MSFKESIERYKERKAERRKQATEIMTAKTAALHKARLEQVNILAKQQAQIERKSSIRRIMQQAKIGKSGGIISGISNRINIAAENLGYNRGGGDPLGLRGPVRKKGKRGYNPFEVSL